MPPKAKFTRDDVISAALDIVTREGADKLTARSLGSALGSSARPIFTVFDSMDEVQSEVVRAAKALYTEYVERGLCEEIAFKGVGKAYIRFASEKPKLFMLLFMRERSGVANVDTVLDRIDDNYERILDSIIGAYGLAKIDAEKLYRHLWIYTHGIAALIATRVCAFTADEISEMLTTVFVGILKDVKSGGAR